MEILVFTRKESNIKFKKVREGLTIRQIPFSSRKLDDLLIIAKHRILNFPTSLVIDGNGKVLLKMHGTVPMSYVNTLCDR